MQNFSARINKINQLEQPLSSHLDNVADLSKAFSGMSLSALIGVLHDFGKATARFQNYLSDGGKRGDVVHSLQGGFFIDDIIGDSSEPITVLLKEIVAMPVAAHHGSLYDGISPDGEDVFIQKLMRRNEVKYHYSEVKQNIAHLYTKKINELIIAAKSEIETIVNQIQLSYDDQKSKQFALGLLVKYIYSCLIDADRLDAYLFESGEEYKPSVADWSVLTSVFEANIQKHNKDDEMSRKRQIVSALCKEAAIKHTGIYQLFVPTGGGKTLSSLRFALHHCRKMGKKRIIYVIPYLSIIEQTSYEVRKILSLSQENDVILEHHSSIITPEDDDERETRKLATSRWDNPIIITTMVQFLETVMSARGSDLRKFHNMSDAVIIFDEIQSLPIKTIHLFNETVSFLAKMRNSTVLLCSATQPRLHLTVRKNLLLEDNSMLIDCSELFSQVKRTVIVAESEKDMDGFADFIAEKAQLNGNCLAIVNTKKSAREIFGRLKSSDFEIVHLSTSMCSKHREDTLAKIKLSLDSNRNIICIATQLIEAGVDISFACVIRAAAGLDSVAQAAGRCNRNGESAAPKNVYVVPLNGENLERLDDIKCGKEITERLIRQHKNTDLSDLAIMDKFYEHYFHGKDSCMDYPLNGGGTLYDFLSVNNAGRGAYRNKTGENAPCCIAHAFLGASNDFCVIDKNTVSVIVVYGEAQSLIEAYFNQPAKVVTKEKLSIVRKLERFSVSLFSHEIERLTEVGAITILDDETGIRVLAEKYYNENVGVVFEINPLEYIQ
jgi:CRISPR-associated endonuclease/helicase Cas3